MIIGPIADDRMNIAMQEFSNGTLTDEGLKACLQCINYGKQFVAKTEFACNQIEILKQRDLGLEEFDEIRDYTYQQRRYYMCRTHGDIFRIMAREGYNLEK